MSETTVNMPFRLGRESIAADKTSVTTRNSNDGESSGSIISERSSDIDDAQTYPGGRGACGHWKPRPVVTGKSFAAEGELEGHAQPSDPYRKDAVALQKWSKTLSRGWKESVMQAK